MFDEEFMADMNSLMVQCILLLCLLLDLFMIRDTLAPITAVHTQIPTLHPVFFLR
jgi:hypothetical protein